MIDVRLFRHLWSFLAVAEEQHFGRAAKRLGISQPPLTQQIQTLERSLGVRLFDRSRRGATLTQEGHIILPAVQRFVEQMARLETLIRAAKEGRTRFITIGAVTSALYLVVPRILETLRTELPEVDVTFTEIHTSEAIAMLESNSVDIAFSRLAMPVGTIRVVPVAKDHLVVALPKGHALQSHGTISIHQLADEPWVQVRRQLSSAFFDAIIAACSEEGFSPRLAHEVESEASQVACVSCGLGIALLPHSFAQYVPSNAIYRPLSRPLEVVTASMAWDEEKISPTARKAVEIAICSQAPRGPVRSQA
jgi:DNA-binding transcriptional LysR family regulator